MGRDAITDLLDAAPGDKGVDQARTLGRDVGIAEAEALPGVHIARRTRVELQHLAAGGPCQLRVVGEHHLLLHEQARLRPHHLAGEGGVLGGRVVGMGARGALRCQLEHLGAQRCEHHRHRLGGRHRRVHGIGHGVEVVAQERQRPGVLDAAHLAHDHRAGDAQAQRETAAGLLGHGVGAHQHHPGMAVVDVGDACGQAEPRGGRPDGGELGERVAPEGLAHPEPAVAEVLDAAGEGDQLGRRQGFGREPHAEVAVGHGLRP